MIIFRVQNCGQFCVQSFDSWSKEIFLFHYRRIEMNSKAGREVLHHAISRPFLRSGFLWFGTFCEVHKFIRGSQLTDPFKFCTKYTLVGRSCGNPRQFWFNGAMTAKNFPDYRKVWQDLNRICSSKYLTNERKKGESPNVTCWLQFLIGHSFTNSESWKYWPFIRPHPRVDQANFGHTSKKSLNLKTNRIGLEDVGRDCVITKSETS